MIYNISMVEEQQLMHLRLLYEEDTLNKMCTDINSYMSVSTVDKQSTDLFDTILDEIDDLEFQMVKTELKSLNVDKDTRYFEEMYNDKGIR